MLKKKRDQQIRRQKNKSYPELSTKRKDWGKNEQSLVILYKMLLSDLK